MYVKEVALPPQTTDASAKLAFEALVLYAAEVEKIDTPENATITRAPQHLTDQSKLYACLDDNKNLLGIAHLILLPLWDTAWLEGIATQPKHRGRGVGSFLIRHVLDEAQQYGCQTVRLFAPSRETTAFYEKFGFREQPSPQPPLYFMQWRSAA